MKKPSSNAKGERVLPFLIEFVKFFIGFAVIVAIGLFSLHVANAALY